jgi:prepilin-type N-terminal cleavage/methylation domain-containing protein
MLYLEKGREQPVERNRRTSAGFTLIELLIVVAIIAILAAIAVPNFLEAQARSKTSRVMADMRSLATAIECYTIDNSTSPIGWAEGVVAFALWDWLPPPMTNFGPYRQLTTPIAYMSSIPTDPFAVYASGNTYGTDPRMHFGEYYHWEGAWHNQSPTPGSIESKGYRWHMRSVGPRRQPPMGTGSAIVWPEDVMASGSTNCIYDATNGTKSEGWIVMTNKGFYKGGPY